MDTQKQILRDNFSDAIANMLDYLALEDANGLEESLLKSWDNAKGEQGFNFKEEFKSKLHKLLWIYLFNKYQTLGSDPKESANELITLIDSMFTKPGSVIKNFLEENQIEGISGNDFRDFIGYIRKNPAYFYALIGIE